MASALILLAGQAKAQDGDIAARPRIPSGIKDVALSAAGHFQAREFDQAAADYWAIIDKYPASLYAWSNPGLTRFQQGQLNAAGEAFAHAVALAPHDALCISDLGLVYYEQEKYAEAVHYLELALELDPSNATNENYLGNCYLKMGLTEKGHAALQKAKALDGIGK